MRKMVIKNFMVKTEEMVVYGKRMGVKRRREQEKREEVFILGEVVVAPSPSQGKEGRM